MKTSMFKSILNISEILSELETRIVLASNLDTSERMHAISELRYYKSLMQDFFEFEVEQKAVILTDLAGIAEEILKWLED